MKHIKLMALAFFLTTCQKESNPIVQFEKIGQIKPQSENYITVNVSSIGCDTMLVKVSSNLVPPYTIWKDSVNFGDERYSFIVAVINNDSFKDLVIPQKYYTYWAVANNPNGHGQNSTLTSGAASHLSCY